MPRVGVAVGIPGAAVPLRRASRRTPTTSPARVRDATCVQRRGAELRNHEEGNLPYFASFVCNPPTRGWQRRSNDSRAVGPQRRQHDDDLHPRVEPRWAWSAEPARRPLKSLLRPERGKVPCSDASSLYPTTLFRDASPLIGDLYANCTTRKPSVRGCGSLALISCCLVC